MPSPYALRIPPSARAGAESYVARVFRGYPKMISVIRVFRGYPKMISVIRVFRGYPKMISVIRGYPDNDRVLPA